MIFYVAFNSLGHIATRQKQRTVKKVVITNSANLALSVEKEPRTAFQNTAHVYSDQAAPTFIVASRSRGIPPFL